MNLKNGNNKTLTKNNKQEIKANGGVKSNYNKVKSNYFINI
jgi:hypothetical protein